MFNIKDIGQRLLDFYKRHTDDITFNMKLKMNGGMYVKYYSHTASSNAEELADSVMGTIIAIVKILKENSENPTQDEILELFRRVVANEFGVTKEEYYKTKESKYNDK